MLSMMLQLFMNKSQSISSSAENRWQNRTNLNRYANELKKELATEMAKLVPTSMRSLDPEALRANKYKVEELVARKALHDRVKQLIRDYLSAEMLTSCGFQLHPAWKMDFATSFDLLCHYVLELRSRNAKLEEEVAAKKRRIDAVKQKRSGRTKSTGTPQDMEVSVKQEVSN